MTVVRSKLDRLIGLLAEPQPPAPSEAPSQAIAPAPSRSSPSQTLHKEMMWYIAALEVAMAALPPRRQDVDDDSPLEPTRFGQFSESDRKAVTNAIAMLKAQPPEPAELPLEGLDAAQLLRDLGTRGWNAASSQQTDALLPAAAKSARSPLGLANRLGAAADAAIHWINSLKAPF